MPLPGNTSACVAQLSDHIMENVYICLSQGHVFVFVLWFQVCLIAPQVLVDNTITAMEARNKFAFTLTNAFILQH